MSKSQIKVELAKGTIFKINPNRKYLIIFNRKDINKGDLTPFDKALRHFFGETKILALFADQLTDAKIAELQEDEE